MENLQGYIVVVRSEDKDEKFVKQVQEELSKSFPGVTFAVFGIGLHDGVDLIQVNKEA